MEHTVNTVQLRNIRQALRAPANDLQDRTDWDAGSQEAMRDAEGEARLFGTACADDMVMGLLTESNARYAIRVHVALADAERNLKAHQMQRLAEIAFRAAGLTPE